MTISASADTKKQILRVAERLFADRGFAGTSLRSVVREAEVNLAAVHYHFGSKEGLYRALVAHIAEQIVTAQSEQLSECVNASDPPQLEAILEAFLAPPLQVLMNAGEQSLYRARFIGRCRTEPDPVQSLAKQEFYASEQSFLDVLQRSLPDQPRTELSWKLDLAIASLVRVAIEAGKPNALLQANTPEEIKKTVSRLVHFLAAGFQTTV